jgi:hypothetical protein
MPDLSQFLESKASIHLLITLLQADKPMIVTEIYDEMIKRFSMGRTSSESAIVICAKLGLVKRETKRIGRNPMASIFHSLTPKGQKIARICLELEKAL